MEKQNIFQKLIMAQNKMKVLKSQNNSFGNYTYRTTEDILIEVKKINAELGLVLTLNDEIVLIGDRYYIKTIAVLTDIETKETIQVNGFAREDLNKKGMDSAQLTGATSSYSSKRALGNLYNLDDNKDSDTDFFTIKQNKEILKEIKEVASGKGMGDENLIKGLNKHCKTNLKELKQFEKVDHDFLLISLEKIKKL